MRTCTCLVKAAIIAAIIALPGCIENPLGPFARVDDPPVNPPPGSDQPTTNSGILIFALRDSTGDLMGPADITGMLMVFDTTMGEYTIYLVADSSHPFPASSLFRININLFNRDLGTTARNPAFFSRTMDDHVLTQSQTMIELRGMDYNLHSWGAGNRVFTNSLRYTGNPEGTSLFRSSVWDPVHGGFLAGEDVIANGSWSTPVVLQKNATTGLTPATRLTEKDVRRIL